MTTRVDDVHRPTDGASSGARTTALFAASATALVAAAATLADLPVVVIFGLTVGAALLACAVAVDVIRFRLPNILVLTAGLVGLVTAAVEARLGEATVAGCIASAPLLVMHLADRRAIGFGDVKFAAAAGALVGSVWAPAALLVPLTALVVAGIVRVIAPHGARPLGPALIGGFVTAVLVAVILHSVGELS